MKKQTLIIVFSIVIAFAGGLVFAQQSSKSTVVANGEGSGKAAIGGHFSLIDSQGKTVTDTQFRGKLMLVYFGFTHCPDLCPTDMAVMSEALHELSADANKVQGFFITVDPDRDDPKQLAEFMKGFDSRIVALTGDKDQLKQLQMDYKVYSEVMPIGKGLHDYVVNHSGYMYLMDKNGEYLTSFATGTPAPVIVDMIRKYL